MRRVPETRLGFVGWVERKRNPSRQGMVGFALLNPSYVFTGSMPDALIAAAA
jgi:hypothetical protein